jgi:hypothetical protein
MHGFVPGRYMYNLPDFASVSACENGASSYGQSLRVFWFIATPCNSRLTG